MKRFFKTIPGKITLFFSCAITLTIAAVAIIAVCLMIGFGFYTKSQAGIFSDLANDRFMIIGRDSLSTMGAFEGRKPFMNIVEENGNAIVKIVDRDGNPVVKSTLADTVEKWDACAIYRQYSDEFGDAIECNVVSNPPVDLEINDDDGKWLFVAYFKLKEGLPEKDYFSTLNAWVSTAYTMRHWSYVIAVVSFVTFAVLYVMLMCVAGRRPDKDEPVPGALNAIPYDLLLVVVVVAFLIVIFNSFSSSFSSAVLIPLAFCLGEAAIWAFLGFSMEAASRVKRKRFVKSTLLYLVFRLLVKGFKMLFKALGKLFEAIGTVIGAIPMAWRTIAVWTGVLLLDLLMVYIFLSTSEDVATVMFIIIKVLELSTVLYLTSGLRRLDKASRALAAGDLEYKTNLSGMTGDIRQCGENLNSISDAMSEAIEEKLKSERMKTVLITNVSHDIKTPLTSIINYTGLISQEQCDNPKIAEYSEVLGRQSERLKRLIEDLVEASKASTGNLEVNLVPCDAGVFVEQAGGEYEDKLAKAQLQLVVKQPQDEIRIMADGRRMWRIFDNLMNNICKYALEGTRVFLSLERAGNNAVFTFKNTSRAPLDMSEDELMERFTRGDSSRNTEGNGLGLSIAKSMAELQKGSLHLDIDGDFFKAILSFPMIIE